MTQDELIDQIRDATGFTRQVIRDVIRAYHHSMIEGIERGEKVPMPKFGHFEVANRAERKGRNVQTGEPLVIPAKRVVKFRTSKIVDNVLNG